MATTNATWTGDGVDGNINVVYYCDEDSFDFATINGAVLIVVFILSFTGNIFIACALLLHKTRNAVTNVFVLNVVFSDLVFTLTLPFWSVFFLHHWVFGEIMCKLVTVFYITGQYSSVLLLTAMTVDRFQTIVLQWPKNRVKRMRYAHASCVAAWLIGIGASMGDAINAKVTNYAGDWLCEDSSESGTITLGYYLQASLLFFLPLAIIVFCYVAILKTVLHASNRKQQRTVVMVLCIVFAFFICWAPYSVFLLVVPTLVEDGCSSQQRLRVAELICRLLAFCHCCVNPVLYMSSQKLRKPVLDILCSKNVCVKKIGEGVAPNMSVVPNAYYTTAQTTFTLDVGLAAL